MTTESNKNTESNNRSCPKCGSTIAPEAPQGLCPKCVMSGVAKEADIDHPQLEAADVPSIERVAAAFPNLDEFELIGRGGWELSSAPANRVWIAMLR